MGFHERQRHLSILAGASACLSIITITCITVPWLHWKEILDTCMAESCGCILYGIQYFHEFAGGKTSLCYFTTFASVPALIIAIILGAYHGCKTCIYRTKKPRKLRRNGEVAVVQSEEENAAPGFIWLILLIIIASCVCILLIITAVYLIDGYYATCREYRRGFTRDNQITGALAAAVDGRLSCGAIFDFMDYLEPVTRPFLRKDYKDYHHPHEELDFQRGPFINTGLSLILANVSICLNCIVWISIIANYAALAFPKCCSKEK